MSRPNTAPTILLDVSNGIGLITLNRPARRNAFDMAMRDEFARTIDTCLSSTSSSAICIGPLNDSSGSEGMRRFSLENIRGC